MDVGKQKLVQCGRFQVLFVTLTQLGRFSSVWSLYIMMFGNYEPPWRCVDKASSRENFLNDSYRATSSEATVNWSQEGNQQYDRSANTDNFSVSSTSVYNGTCSVIAECLKIEFEPGSSTIVTEFGLICDKAWIASLIISIEMLAMVPGSYIGGQLGERFGRKISLYGGSAFLCASVVIGLFSMNWEMYAIFSFCLGLGVGSILSTSVVYSTELLNPRWRAIFLSVPVWNISQLLFTLAIAWLRDWRQLHIAAALVAGVPLIGAVWVPESLRWLETHGKRQEAHEVIRQICQTNRLDLATISGQSDLTTEMIEATDGQTRSEQHTTYLDLFRDRYIRSITVKSSVAWLFNIAAYFALAYGVKSLHGNFYINVIIASASEIPLILLIGPISNRIGRRWSAMSFLCLAAATSSAIVVVHFTVDESSRGMPITVLALVAKAFVAAAWCGLATMSIELYPTVIRNLGYGFLNIVAGAGGVLAPYLIPQNPSWFGSCYSVMTALLIINMVMAMSLPETKDIPLPDAIEMPLEKESTNR